MISLVQYPRPAHSEPPAWWNVVDLEENSLRIPLDEGTSAQLLDKDAVFHTWRTVVG